MDDISIPQDEIMKKEIAEFEGILNDFQRFFKSIKQSRKTDNVKYHEVLESFIFSHLAGLWVAINELSEKKKVVRLRKDSH